MKDIDFDELDRAVSSVLGQDKPVKVKDSPAENVVVTKAPETKNEIQTPEAKLDVSTSTITLNPRPKTTGFRPSGPSLATSRRGKFMDVMHQSVQTQAPSQKPIVDTTPKHELIKLEPSKDLEKASKEDASENKVAPVVTVSTVEHSAEPIAIVDESNALIGAEPVPVDTEVSKTSDESDDKKSVEEKEQEKEEPTSKAEDSEKAVHPNKLEDDLADLSIDDALAPSNASLSSSPPQESPFLADTKVEKRPLGGGSGTNDNDNELAGYGSVGTPEKNDFQSPPTIPVPRELEDDIVKVEAAQNEQDQSVTSSPFAANVATAAEPRDDGRVDGHPLFDTSTYHEPIAAVHHGGMPGWAKWLIGLLLCLAVGAGVGYFLFTAGL